jgi:LPXTG-motif cell wall-anchored protein
VTNPGTVEFSDVTVTDNMVSPVTYVSGDVNDDGLLQPGETWIYTATATITATTTNVAVVSGTAAGVVSTGTATATVVVAGALLPNTATPWYNLLLAGVALTFLGAVGWFTRKTYE